MLATAQLPNQCDEGVVGSAATVVSTRGVPAVKGADGIARVYPQRARRAPAVARPRRCSLRCRPPARVAAPSHAAALATLATLATLAMYRGSRGMSFVRGESSDTEQKGDKYLWAAPQPATTGTFANRSTRARDDDDYFDEPDDAPPSAAAAAVDADDPLEAYMANSGPRPACRRHQPPPPAAADDDDPLDAYMAGLDGGKKPAARPAAAAARSQPESAASAMARRLQAARGVAPGAAAGARQVQACDEAEDNVASFMQKREREQRAPPPPPIGDAPPARRRRRGEGDSDDGDSDDDEAGASSSAATGPRRQLKDQKGKLDLLPPLDHDSIAYAPFNKSFYAEAHAVATMSDEDVAAYARAIRRNSSARNSPTPFLRTSLPGTAPSSACARRASTSLALSSSSNTLGSPASY